MRNKLACLLILVLASVRLLTGQDIASSVSGDLEKLYGRLMRNSGDSVRIQVNDSIISIIESYVWSDTIFNHKFNNLRYLGQITSPDSLVKIVTWNLVLTGTTGRYYCYIVRRQSSHHPHIVYTLTSGYNRNMIRTDTTYSDDNWYGALYYDIRPYTLNGTKHWVLLGIDFGNPYITRKIIEILAFTADGDIVFGMKSFSSSDVIKHREVFEYAATAAMSLRFADDLAIVFDHLVPFSAEYSDDRQYYGPDYSNDAYFLEDGIWRFKLNVDARNSE
jgi:hypothetical protein